MIYGSEMHANGKMWYETDVHKRQEDLQIHKQSPDYTHM